MKREHFYALVIILLLLLNIGTLAFLWMDKPGSGHTMPHGRPGDIMINELQLNEEQQHKFSQYRHVHRKTTDSVQRHLKDAQTTLFRLVKQDEMKEEVRDSLLKLIEQYESAKYLITIQHFHDIRSMLNAEQKELFNDFVEDIGRQLSGPPHPRHGRPPPPHH